MAIPPISLPPPPAGPGGGTCRGVTAGGHPAHLHQILSKEAVWCSPKRALAPPRKCLFQAPTSILQALKKAPLMLILKCHHLFTRIVQKETIMDAKQNRGGEV